MDPLTALGLVSNVLGIIDFTANFVIEVTKLLKSTGDALPQNEWFEGLAQQNQVLSQEIDAAAQNQQLSKLDREICELAKRCNVESQNLIDVLSPLKVAVKNGVKSKRDVVWKAFKSKLLKSDEIQASQAKLGRLELQLSTLLLQSIRASQEKEFASVTKLIDNRGDDAVRALRTSRDEIMQLLNALHQEALTRIKTTEKTTRRVEALLIDAGERERVDRVLASLSFPEMDNRVEAIDEHHRNSFDWMFTDGKLSGANASFKQWLTSEKSIFWVCGEPGSGKSVLMKMLRRHVKTTKNLELWAGGHPFVVCEYYFWIAGGASLQKSTIGLLRTIVYQALSRFPGLLTDPLSRGLLLHTGAQGPAWTTEILINAIIAIAAQVKLCIFVDGLDECDGGPQKLQALVQSLGGLTKLANVKICVSSRPWPIFETAYSSLTSRILLQELTEDDIFSFVTETLEVTDPVMFSQLSCDYQVSESYQDWSDRLYYSYFDYDDRFKARGLIKAIVAKAEGSFLWTALVLDSISTRIEGGEPLDQLEARLDAVPQKLEDYYAANIFERVAETYRSPGCSETAMALKLAMISEDIWFKARSNIHGSLFCFWLLQQKLQHGHLPKPELSMDSPLKFHDFDRARADSMVSRTRKYLSGCCRGLLRIGETESSEAVDYEDSRCKDPFSLLLDDEPVQFKHRTVLDFLRSAQGQRTLEEGIPAEFEGIVNEIYLEAAVMHHRKRILHDCLDIYRLGCTMSEIGSRGQSGKPFWEAAMIRCITDLCPEAQCFSSRRGREILLDVAGLGMLQLLENILQKQPNIVAIASSLDASFLADVLGIQQSGRNCYRKHVPLQAAELALSYGANPNARILAIPDICTLFPSSLGRSVWHILLAFLLRMNRLTDAEADSDFEIPRKYAIDGWDPTNLREVSQRQQMQLASLMIRYGADLQSAVCVADEECLSLRYIAPNARDEGRPDPCGSPTKALQRTAGEYRGYAPDASYYANDHEDGIHDTHTCRDAAKPMPDRQILATTLPPSQEIETSVPVLEASDIDSENAALGNHVGEREAPSRFYIDTWHTHEYVSVSDALKAGIAKEHLTEILALVEEYSRPEKAEEVRLKRFEQIRDYKSAELSFDDIIALGRPPCEYRKAVDVKHDENRLRMLLDVDYYGVKVSEMQWRDKPYSPPSWKERRSSFAGSHSSLESLSSDDIAIPDQEVWSPADFEGGVEGNRL